jgi:cation:H+ antiporter
VGDLFHAGGSHLPLWAAILLVMGASALVAVSAHWTVELAVRVARDLGVSGRLVGLTVVAAGTSAPEFAVTLTAAFEGRGGISVGNVVGSNIFNLGFILGGVALLKPLRTDRLVVWRDGSVLAVAAIVLFGFVGLDLSLGRGEGAILFAGLLLYLWHLVPNRSRRPGGDSLSVRDGAPPGRLRWALAWDTGRLLGSLFLIVVAAQMLIVGGTSVATSFGLSDWVIGVTIIAAGTSLPEFATSVAAVLKGRYGLSLGNIIGSDIFNLLGVLGLTGMLRAVEVDASATGALAALAGMAVVALLFMRTGWTLSRKEGLALVAMAAARWFLDLGYGGVR